MKIFGITVGGNKSGGENEAATSPYPPNMIVSLTEILRKKKILADRYLNIIEKRTEKDITTFYVKLTSEDGFCFEVKAYYSQPMKKTVDVEIIFDERRIAKSKNLE